MLTIGKTIKLIINNI